MHHLANSQLRVDLLDPVTDRARLGPRYCWGGYIWQVHDPVAGPLLTGPEWPSPAPQPHNGQGLPESFRHRTTTGEPLLWRDTTGLAPGVGTLGLDPTGGVLVTDPCPWTIRASTDHYEAVTRQSVGDWSYELVRTVTLEGRRLVSRSALRNAGGAPLILEWFVHPFFALTEGRASAMLPAGTSLPPNPGFVLAGETLTFARAFAGMDDGHLDHLQLPAGQPLVATLSHPRLTHVRFATSFAPFKCVVWANGLTFSLEPFLALQLAPGASQAWDLVYDFGPVAT